MAIPSPAQRKKLNAKPTGIPTRNANPTPKVGRGVGKSSKSGVKVPNNSGNKNLGKTKRLIPKNNPDQISSRSGVKNNRGAARRRSTRVNYNIFRGRFNA